ncbi:hypothetical protein CP967_00010 [Streptomyces nitrosporeus]|uniref:Holin n=2 Tax=Streptomyces nitrosporeus TaxID=28894 RepID=A0A5J6F3D2_9ACTN|nr:hypothetical protein CP967_00010 [Streptomyces nitrosporeus]GGZ30307.1 hypothetical protein GCM10010327_70610 [Streptomyces nitrosporeus]
MKQVLVRFQYAAGLNRRAVVLVGIGTTVTAGVTAAIIWAPVERAELVVSLVSQVTAAIIATVGVEWWKRRRS